MKVAFLEVVNFTDKGTDAYLRNCRYLANFLRAKGHWTKIWYLDDIDQCADTDYDVIIWSYSSFYANFRAMAQIIKQNPKARIFWLTNEYDLRPNGTVVDEAKKRGFDVIANYENPVIITHKKHHFLNLNLLFLEPKDIKDKKFNICYYGTYRKDRAKYFKKYINSTNFILSSTTSNYKKFASIGCKFRPCAKFKWGKNSQTLGLFKYSLYIEDEYIHTHFNNLANRFYEALSNETVTLFDRSCINTIKRSEIGTLGLDYEPFLIDSLDNLSERNYVKDWEIQKTWRDKILLEREKMLEQFYKIIIGV